MATELATELATIGFARLIHSSIRYGVWSAGRLDAGRRKISQPSKNMSGQES